MDKDMVLIMRDSRLGKDVEVHSESIDLLSLPHPSNKSTLATVINGCLYELQSAQLHRNSSWIINQKISSSKNIFFLSKLDMRFLLLPFLENSGTKFSPLDQIVSNISGYSTMPLHLATLTLMEPMCDVNDKLGPDMIVYRYNAQKTIAWLKSKVAAVAEVVKRQRLASMNANSKAFSSSFNVGALNVPQPEHSNVGEDEADTRLALELVGDSLSKSMQDQLFAAYDKRASDILVATSVGGKRKADWELDLDMELEMKLTNVKPSLGNTSASDSNPPPKAVAPNKVTKTNKLNEQAAKGTKSLASFFKAK